MTRPLLGLLFGLAWIVLAVLVHRGHPAVGWLPDRVRRPGNLRWLAGNLLLALAACLGIVGYLVGFNLRMARIALGLLGLALLLLA